MTPQVLTTWSLIFSNSGILLNSKDSTQHGKALLQRGCNRRQKQHISKIRKCTQYVPAGHSGGLSEPPHPQPHRHGDKKKHRGQRVCSRVLVILLSSSLLPWWWLNSNNRDTEVRVHWPCLLDPRLLASTLLLLLWWRCLRPPPRRPTPSCPEAGVSSFSILFLFYIGVELI